MKKKFKIFLTIVILNLVMVVNVFAKESLNITENEVTENTEIINSESKNMENTNSEVESTKKDDYENVETLNSESKSTEDFDLETEDIQNINLEDSNSVEVDSENNEEVELEELTYVNPVYRDIVSEKDITELKEASKETSKGRLLYAPVECSTIEEAGRITRSGLKLRNKTIQITYKTNTRLSSSIYEKIIDEAMKHTGVPTEGDYIAWQYGAWNARGEGKAYNGIYYYTLTFTFKYYTTYEQERTMDRAVSNLLNTLNLKGSDYEKVTAIYDYICSNISYDYTSSGTLKHTAYAALINKKSVCQGYAVLFYRLALESKIDARLIAGLGNGGAHGWNIVKIGNRYYNLDATWDAGHSSRNYNYYLLSDDNFIKHTRDSEYLTSDFYAKYPMGTQNYTAVTQVSGVWRMVKDGKVQYYYTGFGDNEYGTWFVKDGAVNFNYVGSYLKNNVSYIIEGAKVVATVSPNTTEVTQINGKWRMVEKGEVKYDYTGIGRNNLGTWFVKDGTINFNYTGKYKSIDGKTYVIQNNKVMTDLNKLMLVDNVWSKVENGVINYNYNGLAENEYGIWYVKNGIVDFKTYETYFGYYKDCIAEGSKIVATVDPDTTEVMQINGKWRMVEHSRVLYDYTGIGANNLGTWYVKNGTIDFNYTGTYNDGEGKTYYIYKNQVMLEWKKRVVQIGNEWRIVRYGTVDYSYTGLGENEYGIWYVKNGIVDFKTRDTYVEANKSYIIEGSKVVATANPNTTTVMQVNGKWRMVKDGKVIYNYTGIGTNNLGTWYVKNGTIDFNYSGCVVIYEGINGTTYMVDKNRIMTDLTKVVQINGVWRMVQNGIVKFNYTGIGSNEYGTWYVKNGTINFDYTGTFRDDNGRNYRIENNKVIG